MLTFIQNQMKENPMNEVCCYKETTSTERVEKGNDYLLGNADTLIFNLK